LRGIALEELGRKNEALEAYKQAINLDPEFREAKKNLSLLEQDLAEKYQSVTIATYDHTVEANIAKDILESEGIFSVIIETRRGGGIVPQTWGFGRACLQVRKPDVERACELLDIKPVVSEELEEEGEEDQEPQEPAARRSLFTRHEKRERIPPSKKRKQ
jgi:tetratricopeptide (TPR) repeat protein